MEDTNPVRRVVVALATAGAIVASVFGIQSAGPGLYETQRTLWPAYQAVPRTWDKWGPKTSLEARIDAMAERLAKHRTEGFQLRRSSSDEWSTTRPLIKTMGVLGDRMRHDKVGAVWFVKAKEDQYQEKIRKLDLNPAVATATEGTDPIDIVVGTLKARHANLNIGGIYVVRPIAGSSTWSQHAYANAVDVSGSYTAMNQAAQDLYRMTRNNFIPVSQILWNHENMLSGNYVYDHTNHIHFSGAPLLSGSPRPAP